MSKPLNEIQAAFVSDLQAAILEVCKKYKASIELEGRCHNYETTPVLSVYIPYSGDDWNGTNCFELENLYIEAKND
jgi:hypothetical protein